jgi:hypothetical protein
MDLFRGSLSYLESLREVRAISGAIPDTPILALAVPETAEQVIACADAGVCGYSAQAISLLRNEPWVVQFATETI